MKKRARKPRSSSSPKKRKKTEHTFSENIDMDVRNEINRSKPSAKSLEKFVLAISGKHVDKPPAIFPLLEKMYLPKDASKTLEYSDISGISDREAEKLNLKITEQTTGSIMKEKIKQYSSKQEVISSFSNQDQPVITMEEINLVNTQTVKQWKCKEWYTQKAGIISASKAKRVHDFQISLKKCANKDVSKLVREIANPNVPSYIPPLPDQPQNPRDWGLKHEATARKNYTQVQRKQHCKLRLESKGFMISKDKPFLGASVDDLRHCECEKGCSVTVVEYKCPWKHRDIQPKEAFLTPEVGGIQKGNNFMLKRNCRYYFQVQLQMFVYQLCLCDFVVWTKHGLFSVEIPFDEIFMLSVIERLQEFWSNHVLPFLMLQCKFSTYFPILFHTQGSD